MFVASSSPPALIGQQEEREDERREDLRGLAQRAHHRAAREHADLGEQRRTLTPGRPRPRPRDLAGGPPPSASSSSPAPSSERPVFVEEDVVERRRVQLEVVDARCPRASSARTTSARSRLAAAQAHGDAARAGRRTSHGSPKRSSTAAAASRSVGVGGHRLDRRAADLGLQRRGRALGHDPAVVDDPDAVGQDVGLLEVLRGQEDRDAVLARPGAPTSSHSALRLCGSRPVVGSSRNRMRGRCTSASARSSRRFMPPE